MDYLLENATDFETAESYRISFSTSSRAVTVSFPLGGPHALNLRAEYFRSASLPKEYEKAWGVKADWKFRSIPLTATYTYAFKQRNSPITPVVGVGLSAHFFRETRQVDAATGLPFSFVQRNLLPYSGSTNSADRLGLKYGAEVSLGFRTDISKHIFVLTQGRYRYVNCSTESLFSRGYGPLSVLDFNLEIGFEL
jgi:hypothetical protein